MSQPQGLPPQVDRKPPARCPGWRLGDAWTDVGRTPG